MKKLFLLPIFFVILLQPLSVDSALYNYENVYFHDGFKVGDTFSWKVTAFKIGSVTNYNETMLSGIKDGSNITLEIIKATDGVDINDHVAYKVEDYFRLFVDGQPGVLGDNAYPSIVAKEYTSSSSSQSLNVPLIAPYRMVLANGTEKTYRDDLQNDIDTYNVGTLVDNGDSFTVSFFGASETIDKATYQLLEYSASNVFGWFTIALEPLTTANNNSKGNNLDTLQFISIVTMLVMIVSVRMITKRKFRIQN